MVYTPYCKHGHYVGSPGGFDYMCGACEMGDPDPTLREMRAYMAETAVELEERALEWEQILVETGSLSLIAKPDMQKAMLSKLLSNYRTYRSGTYAVALEFSRHDDDCDWLHRAHKAMMADD